MKKILSIIPAAGRGSRMLSLTDNCAKSMIPVAGRPLIAYLLDQLISAKLKDVVIIVGYQKDTIINYVDTFYKDKLNITYVEQKELLGLGHAIYEVTQQVNISIYDGVFIMLGDAIFNTNKIFNFSKSYVACEEMIDFSRWCIAVEKDGKLVKMLDKPKVKPDKNLALVGAYYFDDSSLFIKSVTDAINSGITIKNEYQLSTAIDNYKASKDIYIIDINEDEWFDFGELDTYNTNRKKFNQSRFFNNISYENDTITKRSDTNNHKIQDETCWYLALPSSLSKYHPNLVDYNLDDTSAYYTIDYCTGNTLQEIWLYNNLSEEQWLKIIHQIQVLIDDFKSCSNKHTIDFGKFIKSQIEKRVDLESFFDNKYSTINRKKYNLESLKTFFEKYLDDFIKDNNDSIAQICHGDLVFSNIIYNSANNSLKLIDPRGNFCDNIIYGDIRYDIAKLSQCVIGNYDYIVNGLYTLDGTNYTLYSSTSNELKQKLFDVVTTGYNKNDILFLVIVQFMTMIPLHKENENNQMLMHYRAIELLNDLYNNCTNN